MFGSRVFRFRLPRVLVRNLRRHAERVISSRPPDFVLPDYMERWHVFRSERLPSLYVHRLIGSDHDSAYHDHRGWNVSVLLSGWYRESMPRKHLLAVCERDIGDIVIRGATALHRIQLGKPLLRNESVLTLFVTGPTKRQWGFWIPHYDFESENRPDLKPRAEAPAAEVIP